jgi:hypothetical protein
MPGPRKQLWFRVRGQSKDGTRAWFTIYRERGILVEAILSARQRRAAKSLPVLLHYRCRRGVKTKDDVCGAIKNKFKVKNLRLFGR